jgi:hypothetical protein
MNDMSTPPDKKPAGPHPDKAQQEPTKGKALATFSAGRDYAEFLPAAVELSVRPVPYVVPVLLGVIIALIYRQHGLLYQVSWAGRCVDDHYEIELTAERPFFSSIGGEKEGA